MPPSRPNVHRGKIGSWTTNQRWLHKNNAAQSCLRNFWEQFLGNVQSEPPRRILLRPLLKQSWEWFERLQRINNRAGKLTAVNYALPSLGAYLAAAAPGHVLLVGAP